MKSISNCSICGNSLGEYSVHTEYFSLIEENKKIGNLGGFICNKCVIKETGVNKFYHLSNSCDIIDEFIPRVPENRSKDEDSQTPRVSLSSSIEGCLTGVSWASSRIEECYIDLEEESSYLIRVYEFDIEDLDVGSLISTEYLYFDDLVRDSCDSKEYWYTSCLKPSRSYLIELINNDIEPCDYVKCDDMMNFIRSDGDFEQMHYDEIVDGWYAKIIDLEYRIIPEDRRSGVYVLNHEIMGAKLEDRQSIENDIFKLYSTSRTYIDLEERDERIYIIGEVDTRNDNHLGEVDVEKIIDYLNENISKGEIKKESVE